MLALLEEAASRGATLVVFPELAFTTFFPRWLIEGDALDHYFERGCPTRPCSLCSIAPGRLA